jgi:hypothetical protein
MGPIRVAQYEMYEDYSALRLFGEFQVQLVSGTETMLYCFVTLLNI